MIISDKREKYDGSLRIVMWEKDEDGKCVSRLEKVEFDEDINLYYAQKEKELRRLQRNLFAGEISPISFFMQFQNMTVTDTAARVRLSAGKVRKHMTPEGFDGIKVETLKRYAKVFDIVVSDLFQFTHLTGELDVEMDATKDRLVQRLTISIKE